MSRALSGALPCYRVDGRRVATEVPLPLPREDGGAADWTLTIEREPVPLADDAVEWTGDVSQESGRWGRFGRWRGKNLVRLEGLFDLVADLDGHAATLHHDRGHEADPGMVRHALPYLGALERRLVLHAAGVVFPEGAVLLCAEAQTGKSTLALALDGRGYPVLGDDHIAVEMRSDGPCAFASLPTIDTLPASRVVFFPDEAARPGKSSAPCRTPRPAGAVPVHQLVFLRRDGHALPRRLPATDAVRRLLLDVLFVGDPGDLEEQGTRFEQAVALAKAVPAYEISLPDGLERLARALPQIVGMLRGPERPASPAGRLDVLAVAWVAAIRASLTLLPLPRVRALVAWAARVARRAPRGAGPDPRSVGQAVKRATRAVPRATCLVQALAAQGLLARHGLDGELHLGAMHSPEGGLDAHAWVECDGHVIVGDGPGAHTRLGAVELGG